MILINDLDSMAHRIEALPPHPNFTAALQSVQQAKAAVAIGQRDLHHREMRERFAETDRDR